MKKRGSSFKGHLWAWGNAEDELHSKRVDDEGKEWFAITAFPLFAGTFGTIASALNICALVQPWKCDVSHEDSLLDIKNIPDPTWLIVANSISLFFGVTANITTLLIRGDNSFSLSKHVLELVFITIACGFAAALVLISCVVAAFYELRYPVPPKHAFTDAYFYAIEAAALYFITSAFIIYTAYMLWKSRRTRDDLSKQFAGGHLSLKILTVIFAAYILLGALVFSNIENWRYLDAVFWADVTILTVGFGDFRPQTHLGKSLIFPYATFGVFFLVLILYCITQVVFERGSSLWEARIRDQERRREVQKRKFRGRMVKKELAPPEIQLSLPSFSFSRKIDKRTTHPASHLVSKNSTQTEKFTRSSRQHEARERRRVDFEKMRDIALYATSRRIFLSIFLWFLFSIFLWFGGAMLFYLSEHKQGWTYFNAVYFTFVALLTIGYGDNNLLSMPGKAIFVLWSLIVIPSLTMLISTGSELVGMPYLTSTKRWVKRRFKRRRGAEKKLKGEGRRLANVLEPSTLTHNNHDKNHLIIQAIKSIAHDHIYAQTNKERPSYAFEDWEYIFYLMGILNSNDEDSETTMPQLGDRDRGASENAEIGEGQTRIESWQGEEHILDWLHGKNPLNVSETLTEWMLLTLVERLEGELGELREKLGRRPSGGQRPDGRAFEGINLAPQG